MLARNADRAAAVPSRESACFHQPSGAHLDLTSFGGPMRRRAAESRYERFVLRHLEHRIEEERPDAATVRIIWIEDHALAAAQRQHGVPYERQRGLLPQREVEGLGELGVPDRCG